MVRQSLRKRICAHGIQDRITSQALDVRLATQDWMVRIFVNLIGRLCTTSRSHDERIEEGTMMMETFERTEGEEVIGSLGDQLVEANATIKALRGALLYISTELQKSLTTQARLTARVRELTTYVRQDGTNIGQTQPPKQEGLVQQTHDHP